MAGVTNQSSFLAIARILEDIGVSAYGGAAPLIADKDILGAVIRHRGDGPRAASMHPSAAGGRVAKARQRAPAE